MRTQSGRAHAGMGGWGAECARTRAWAERVRGHGHGWAWVGKARVREHVRARVRARCGREGIDCCTSAVECDKRPPHEMTLLDAKMEPFRVYPPLTLPSEGRVPRGSICLDGPGSGLGRAGEGGAFTLSWLRWVSGRGSDLHEGGVPL